MNSNSTMVLNLNGTKVTYLVDRCLLICTILGDTLCDAIGAASCLGIHARHRKQDQVFPVLLLRRHRRPFWCYMMYTDNLGLLRNCSKDNLSHIRLLIHARGLVPVEKIYRIAHTCR